VTIAAPAPARGRSRGRLVPYWLLAPGLVWLAVFLVVLMVSLGTTSLQTGNPFDGFTLTWEWSNYTNALSTYRPQLLRSFLYAGLATVAALIIAYPLAYAIALKAGRWRNLLLVLVVAPFFTSFLVRTLAWQTLLSDSGTVVSVLRDLHLLDQDGRLLATPIAVVCGLTYNFLPFMVLPLYASLEKLDPRVVEAANDLYATPFTAFRRVTLPMSMPGVVGGTLLTFIPAAGDFVNAQFLGSPGQQMIGNVVESRFLVALDYPTASALSFVLLLAILVLVMAYVRRAGTEELV